MILVILIAVPLSHIAVRTLYEAATNYDTSHYSKIVNMSISALGVLLFFYLNVTFRLD